MADTRVSEILDMHARMANQREHFEKVWDDIAERVAPRKAEFKRRNTAQTTKGKQRTEKMFDAVVNLNLKGPFRLSALIGEQMMAAGGGSIINVSTHGSLRPHPSFIPYAASKAGLNAMTEGLAMAFGPTVRVNTLMPGPFLTDISKAWNFGDTNPFGHFALQRAGNPSEIVGAALFLMSDASSYTTGSILRVDGGPP